MTLGELIEKLEKHHNEPNKVPMDAPVLLVGDLGDLGPRPIGIILYKSGKTFHL